MVKNNFIDPKLANEFGKDYVKILVGLLKGNKPHPKVASGSLINSINYKLKDTANGIQIQLLSEDYIKFVDQGVNGTQKSWGSPYSYRTKKPPIQEIKRWVSIKGLPQGSAYAIRNNIFKFGIKPTKVISKARGIVENSRGGGRKYEEMLVNNIVKYLEKSWLVSDDYKRLNQNP